MLPESVSGLDRNMQIVPNSWNQLNFIIRNPIKVGNPSSIKNEEWVINIWSEKIWENALVYIDDIVIYR